MTELTEQQEAVVQMAIAERKVMLDKAIAACTALDQGEEKWQFSLSDGLVAKVMFHGGHPSRSQLMAFCRIFAAVAENYVAPVEVIDKFPPFDPSASDETKLKWLADYGRFAAALMSGKTDLDAAALPQAQTASIAAAND